MPTTVIPDRFHNAIALPTAGLITPAMADKVPLWDASASDAKSYATWQSILFNLSKTRHRYTQRYFTDADQEYGLLADNRFAVLATGAGSGVLVANDIQGRIGIVRLATGNNSSSAAVLTTSDNIVRLGGGAWFYETALTIPTLSTSGERYSLFCGFFDHDFANNAIWLYDEGPVLSGGAAYWQTVTFTAATATTNANHTQITVAANTWYRLGLEVNAAASEVKFYIDGTLRATHSTNIPSASGTHLGVGVYLLKNTGTTDRQVDVDYCGAVVDFSSAR